MCFSPLHFESQKVNLGGQFLNFAVLALDFFVGLEFLILQVLLQFGSLGQQFGLFFAGYL
jgi:hypothetical protein